MPTYPDKKAWRDEMRQKRDSLSPEQIGQAAEGFLNCLTQLKEFQEAEWIYSFVAIGSEPDTIYMIPEFMKQGKRVEVPKVEGQEIEFYEIKSIKDCRPGAYGILEPASYQAPVDEPGFILIPGLAFDREGNRLGYGGGFYDRYLQKHSGFTSAALAYEFQIADRIPRQEHDQTVDYIVTPKESIRVSE